MACILLWSSAVRVHDSQAYRDGCDKGAHQSNLGAERNTAWCVVYTYRRLLISTCKQKCLCTQLLYNQNMKCRGGRAGGAIDTGSINVPLTPTWSCWKNNQLMTICLHHLWNVAQKQPPTAPLAPSNPRQHIRTEWSHHSLLSGLAKFTLCVCVYLQQMISQPARPNL